MSDLMIVKSILEKNPCYIAGKKIKVTGIMLHSVGCPQPSAKVFVSNWNSKSYTRACVHGFIDANNGYVYQTLPWNYRGWHCASGSKGSGNNTHIGIEMCEPSYIKYTSGSSFTCSDKEKAIECVERTYNSAVKLFAKLCNEYNLNPLKSGVILSHKEGASLGIASNHGDPEHLWKGLGLKYTMNGFRKDVDKELKRLKRLKGVVVTESKPITSTTASSFKPYKVKIIADTLNVRSGAGTKYKIVTRVKKGQVYTIVKEVKVGKDLWGKLKSGSGYISLAHTKKV